jgi:EAL domain-containing protein (putative c-di-GMP-specific phosphodiesterase class I)
MPEPPEIVEGGTTRAHRDPPPSLGALLPRVVQQFDDEGALGVLLVDASPLAEIERQYGARAYRQTFAALAALVTELIGDQLLVTDLLVAGESGREELAVLLFREPAEVEFYKRELGELAAVLTRGLERRGHRVGYPYTRTLPPPEVGFATALRNPLIREEAQIRAAMESARDHVELRRRIESRRRRAQLFELVIEGSLYSVYEPIVEVETRTVFGYEALARGPEGSELHSPARLFATATEQDLLFQLDCLCRQRGLDGARDLPGGAKLFLNVRPTTIHDPNFRAEALERTLARCQLSPSDVVFEISEQESIDNFEIFREVRDYYGKLGFQIALDDTGAGYASLEAVMELAPEFIKVDRAFVAGIDEDSSRQELLRALQSLAQRLGARIIGEGLDTLEELETLRHLEIPYGQGWLFGKPHPLRRNA